MTLVRPRPDLRVLTAAQLIASTGDGAYIVTSALYFTGVVGMSPAQVGVGLTLGWAVGAVAGVPLGHLADRRGPRGVAVLLALATAVAVASFVLVRSFAPFVVVACAYGAAQTGLSAARQALLAGLVEATSRTRTRAALQSAHNAGLAIGAALGGLALHLNVREAYLTVLLVDAACFVAAALVLLRLPAVPPAPVVAGPRLAVLRDRPYALVTLINTVMLLYMPMLSLIVPLWIAQRTAAPTWSVSALLLVNTAGVVLFQVRVAGRIRGLADASSAVRLAGLVMLGACAVFALSAFGSSPWTAVAVLLAGVALQVTAELLLASGSWEISFSLAPEDKQGQYQGFFGSGTAVARMLGPALLTTLVMGWGTSGWIVLGLVFVGAGAAMPPAVRWARRRTALTDGAVPADGAALPE
ncbi:MFS transporter [Nonomuraea roseoviolacea]|uniref:MFS family permease n=1 Tax=Nonomuraea roseoviolacea subsp. carminata TaxID=160689 RepID=A0ABT1JZX9_9ACTN|nr:MFS transporter [Nonomuraea roseoviolacea]MCP2347311.1 MFS family permease [Nonomuraea roseoviolacea subsp. carminata]